MAPVDPIRPGVAGALGGLPDGSAEGALMSNQSNTGDISTEQAVAGLFRLALKAPANIAPERLGQLGALITEPRWTLAMVGGNANFYAIVPDKKIALSSAGLAALWNIAYVAFRIADESTRQRQQEQAERK